MFQDMGTSGSASPEWQDAAYQRFAARVASPDVCLIVVEVEDVVVASAMGTLREAAPSPLSPQSGDVLISNVATDPRYRRRGHARAAVHAVLQWAAPPTSAELSSWLLLRASRCTSTPASSLLWTSLAPANLQLITARPAQAGAAARSRTTVADRVPHEALFQEDGSRTTTTLNSKCALAGRPKPQPRTVEVGEEPCCNCAPTAEPV